MGKPNFSKIGRDLNKDPRTIKKYYDGFQKATTRSKSSKIDELHEVICELLSSSNGNIATFNYIDHLYRYLTREYNLRTSRSNFHYYISSNELFKKYFKKNKSSCAPMSETPLGKQAQLDWKEKIKYIYSTGMKQTVHVGSLVLSASGQKVFRV